MDNIIENINKKINSNLQKNIVENKEQKDKEELNVLAKKELLSK